MEQTSSLDSIARQVMNTNPHHPQNWLDRCPAEILLNIFRFACSDDGTTGRALSLVSRRVSIISREVKLRALAIVGPKQIISSAKMLAETPLKHRRIIHLFIATIPQREKLTDIPLSSSFLLTRSGLTDQQVANLSRSFTQILELASSTVQTIWFVTNLPRIAILLHVPLPYLRRLTLFGPFPARVIPESKRLSFPLLQTLEFIAFGDYTKDLFEDIQNCAPNVEEILFRPGRVSPSLHLDLEAALDDEAGPSNSLPRAGLFSKGRIPSTVKRVTVQPCPKPALTEGQHARDVYGAMTKKLLFLSRWNKKLQVVAPADVPEYSDGKSLWLQLTLEEQFPLSSTSSTS